MTENPFELEGYVRKNVRLTVIDPKLLSIVDSNNMHQYYNLPIDIIIDKGETAAVINYKMDEFFAGGGEPYAARQCKTVVQKIHSVCDDIYRIVITSVNKYYNFRTFTSTITLLWNRTNNTLMHDTHTYSLDVFLHLGLMRPHGIWGNLHIFAVKPRIIPMIRGI